MTKWWSDTVSGVTESAEVLQALVKTRSSWFPAPVGGWRGEEWERVYLPGHTPAPRLC